MTVRLGTETLPVEWKSVTRSVTVKMDDQHRRRKLLTCVVIVDELLDSSSSSDDDDVTEMEWLTAVAMAARKFVTNTNIF